MPVLSEDSGNSFARFQQNSDWNLTKGVSHIKLIQIGVKCNRIKIIQLEFLSNYLQDGKWGVKGEN